jgi:hypothetical protein
MFLCGCLAAGADSDSTSYYATMLRPSKNAKRQTKTEPRSVHLVEHDVTNANTADVHRPGNQVTAAPLGESCISGSTVDRQITNDNDMTKPHSGNGHEHQKTNS